MAYKKFDDRPTECRIFINLKNKKIRFDHLVDKKSKMWYAINCVCPTIGSLCWIFLLLSSPVVILFMFINSVMWSQTGNIEHFKNMLIVPILFLSMIYLRYIGYILVYIPGFNSKIFPKIGKICHSLTSDSTEIIVNKIENKKFEIPMFTNAFISYECYGDFNNCLERIEIIDHPIHWMQKKIKWRCRHWKASFFFNKNPRDGSMFISYI